MMATLCDVLDGGGKGGVCLYDSGRFPGGKVADVRCFVDDDDSGCTSACGQRVNAKLERWTSDWWIGCRRNARWTLQVPQAIPSKRTWSNQMLVRQSLQLVTGEDVDSMTGVAALAPDPVSRWRDACDAGISRRWLDH
jgi:hypothetical protein